MSANETAPNVITTNENGNAIPAAPKKRGRKPKVDMTGWTKEQIDAYKKEQVKLAQERMRNRPRHHLVGSKDISVYPFKVTPADFDFKSMRPLEETDFVSKADYLEYRAKECDYEAARFRKRAENERNGITSGKNTTTIVKALKTDKLRAMLAGKGIDVAEMLAELQKELSKPDTETLGNDE